MTIQEIYELIKQKIENAYNDMQQEKDTYRRELLIGEIRAYIDIRCLIERSNLLEVEKILQSRLSVVDTDMVDEDGDDIFAIKYDKIVGWNKDFEAISNWLNRK